MELETNVFEAGTGAVRSVEVVEERWDLMSGFALKRVREVSDCHDYFGTPIELLTQADDLIGEFLGGERRDNLETAAFRMMVAISLIDHPECEAEFFKRFEKHGCEDQRKWKHLPYWGLIRLATTCHEGATKYGEENWHHGFTVKSLCNHALRHIRKWVSGDDTEDHLGHALWNVVAAIHMFHKHPEMCKLLLGRDYTITPELQDYHDAHASRRRMSKAERSRQDLDTTLAGPGGDTAVRQSRSVDLTVETQIGGQPDPFRNLPNDGSLRSVGKQ